MRQLAIVLTHNLGDSENEAQIQALISLVEKQTQVNEERDEEGNVIGSFNTYYYTIEDFPDIEVKFYQIVPFGVKKPQSIDLLDSYKVIYGTGDEDKTGDHPRFFNWGTKRATDFGAEAVIHLEDYTKLKTKDLIKDLEKILSKADNTEITEDASSKVISLLALKKNGQLDESKNKQQAFDDYKERMEVSNG